MNFQFLTVKYLSILTPRKRVVHVKFMLTCNKDGLVFVYRFTTDTTRFVFRVAFCTVFSFGPFYKYKPRAESGTLGVTNVHSAQFYERWVLEIIVNNSMWNVSPIYLEEFPVISWDGSSWSLPNNPMRNIPRTLPKDGSSRTLPNNSTGKGPSGTHPNDSSGAGSSRTFTNNSTGDG